MNIWSLLISGAVWAYFASRREAMRKFLDGSSKKQKQITNKDHLRHSLNALIDFLSMHEEFRWSTILRSITSDLNNTATEQSSLGRLSELFGGMGSLNDVVLNRDLDHELGLLLDSVFRDMKLYYGTTADRVYWKKLEEQHKDELPPRIKHAFRRN